jgi:hypothetical protein
LDDASASPTTPLPVSFRVIWSITLTVSSSLAISPVMAGRPSQQRSAGDALRLACRRYFRRLARTLGASRDGNGRFQLDEPLGDELRPIIRAFLSPLRT